MRDKTSRAETKYPPSGYIQQWLKSVVGEKHEPDDPENTGSSTLWQEVTEPRSHR
jgi:hypothetical protein